MGKNCSWKDTDNKIYKKNEIISVYKKVYNNQYIAQKSLNNPYITDDPPLPRFKNIVCKNDECPTNTEGANREIIFIKYDNKNLKYLYICSTCKCSWKTN